MTTTHFSDSDVTRLATVNPTTGMEMSLSSIPEDATVVRAINAANVSAHGITEEFVPPQNACSTVEVTRQWRGRASWWKKVYQIFTTHPRRSIAVVLGAIASVSAVVAVLGPFSSEIQKVPTTVIPEKKTAETEAVDVTSSIPGHTVSLERAVQQLCHGHFEEAKKTYNELALLFPEDESFPLAITILDTLEAHR